MSVEKEIEKLYSDMRESEQILRCGDVIGYYADRLETVLRLIQSKGDEE